MSDSNATHNAKVLFHGFEYTLGSAALISGYAQIASVPQIAASFHACLLGGTLLSIAATSSPFYKCKPIARWSGIAVGAVLSLACFTPPKAAPKVPVITRRLSQSTKAPIIKKPQCQQCQKNQM